MLSVLNKILWPLSQFLRLLKWNGSPYLKITITTTITIIISITDIVLFFFVL